MDKDSNTDDPPGPLETIINGPEQQAPLGMAGSEQQTLLPTVASKIRSRDAEVYETWDEIIRARV